MPFIDHVKQLLAAGRLNVSARFALLQKAIQGTMSSFYMARDLRTNKIVGLKILDPKKTAEFNARFKGLKKPTEGEISYQLKHPSIVETFEYGLTTEDEHYLVMEFLEGADAAFRLGRPRSDLRRPACEIHPRSRRGRGRRSRRRASSTATSAPEISCSTNDGNDIKLIDFGLTVPATKEFMQPGNRTGTPNYMAPELVRRRATDQRLDVFAFGVTAYEICTFELPWMRGTTGMAAMTHDQPPDRHPQIPPANQSHAGQGDPLLHRAGRRTTLPLDGKIPPNDPRSETRRYLKPLTGL